MTTLSDLLRQDHRERAILVEIDYMAEDAGAPTLRTLYFSSSSKTTQGRYDLTAGDQGSPQGPPVIYEDCLNSIPAFTRSLSGPLGSTYSSSLGSIEIDNADGDKDYVLALALDGSDVRFYLWDSGIKYLVFKAIALRVSVPSFDRISIALKDAGVLLNKSVGGTDLIGGTGPNADQWRPINFGYVHNLEAKVLDASSLTYVHSDTGLFTAAVDVRDKGLSVSYTDNGDGTFTLDASPAGIVTCDVVASYDGTDATRRVSDALQFIIGDRQANNQGQGFDAAGPTYTVGDDDDYLIGISIPEARNIVDLLNQICDSGNCFWAIKRTGEFTYGRLRPNDIEDFGFTTAQITEDDYDNGSWKIEPDPPGYYLLQAYMSRNWTQQTDFAGALTPDEQAVFTRPGIFLLQDTAVGTAYADIPEAYDRTLSISPALDTLLSGGFDELDLPYLAAWMETRRFMQLPWIERLSMTVGLEWYFLELGDPVEIVTPRYDLAGGVLFQVISININLTSAKIDLVLLRRHVSEPLPPDWQRITAGIEFIPPPIALRPVITPPPFPPGTSPEICGWLFDPRRGWFFVPCGGGGGGGGPTSYSFASGGPEFVGTGVDLTPYLDADVFHSPPWYTITFDTITFDTTQIDLDDGGIGTDVFVPLTLHDNTSAHPARVSNPRALNYPAFCALTNSNAFPTAQMRFVSLNNQNLYDGVSPPDAFVFDYVAAASKAQDLHFFVPGGSSGDVVLGPAVPLQTHRNYDLDGNAQLGIAVALITVGANLFVQNAPGHLLLTVQNNSGSTLTDLDIPSIFLPTNAIDPDALTGDEFDVSFAGGVQAVCVEGSTGLGGTLTPTVGGDRHELNFTLTSVSIPDGDFARFVFPIQCPTANGVYSGYPGRVYLQPAFAGTITTTPVVTVKLFTDPLGNPQGLLV